MSMTQVAFLQKRDIPTHAQIQKVIRGLSYDFSISADLETHIDQNGLECLVNGHKTYFETDVVPATDILNEADWLALESTNQDTAITFVWGADHAAGACIGLISVALIDLCNASVFYLDDEMVYTRQMLIDDIPYFLQN